MDSTPMATLKASHEDRRRAQADLEAKLVQALDSGPASELTADDWASLRERLRANSERR